jgi:hypothetical protein
VVVIILLEKFMARKKVLTKGETDLIRAKVSEMVKAFVCDVPIEDVYNDVVQIYLDQPIKVSDGDLERNVIFNIGYTQGGYEGYSEGFHQGFHDGLKETSSRIKSRKKAK